jgi:hypothetical protein
MVVTLQDPTSGVTNDYFLSDKTVIDGLPFKCDAPANSSNAGLPSYFSPTIATIQMCTAFPPQFLVGKTHVALLYWKIFGCQEGHATHNCVFFTKSPAPELATDDIISLANT